MCLQEFYLLFGNEGFERDSVIENAVIPRIYSCLRATEKEKRNSMVKLG